MGVQSPVLTPQVKPEALFFFFFFKKEGISLSEWCCLQNLNSGINIYFFPPTGLSCEGTQFLLQHPVLIPSIMCSGLVEIAQRVSESVD